VYVVHLIIVVIEEQTNKCMGKFIIFQSTVIKNKGKRSLPASADILVDIPKNIRKKL